jgi:phosphatidylserine/phosphatidylglycerophosphate/cardiolipin synthase-like enzyme
VEHPQVPLSVLRDRQHYERLVEALRQAQVSLWIATANVRDVHIEAPVGTRARARGRYMSIVELLGDLARRGVELRVLHGALPTRRFQQRLAARRLLEDDALAMHHCPRVHLKMVVIDGRLLYLGSANLTGAGLGAKADGRRNFELGMLTEDELLLDEMQAYFESIWSGARCGGCRMRSLCPAPLDGKAAG